ncbi:hypothetical protein FCULG_00012318 [Fusarium culmorum]|uniref:Uncharacterized protein n=1 Tax=Fusarium culmorum TaxID=5516 RepID=A0A2T4GRP8_FUSCU|nr:hypothetical protein FCULG_00012318 [Fusarium culmorum]
MSSPSPQVKVPDLYRSSPASVMQIRSVSGMWPSQLFADAVPRSWSKNVLVSLAKIISSASIKADTTVDDVVAWFKDNAESCGGFNQEACTQADRWLRGCLLGQRRESLPSKKILPDNCEELVRSKHISIFREKSAPAEDRLNEAKTLLDEIESRVALVTKHQRYVDGYQELALPDAPTYHVQALKTAQSELEKASQDAQAADGVLASAQKEQRDFKRVEENLVMLGAERATLDQSVRDLTLDKERRDVYLGMVEYGPDGLATLLEEDVGAWKGMLDLV